MESPSACSPKRKETIFRNVDQQQQQQQESPTSTLGLYPIVHDLSEVEYDCCFDPISMLMHNFLNGDDGDDEETIQALTAKPLVDDEEEEDPHLLMAPDLSTSTCCKKTSSRYCDLNMNTKKVSEDSFRELPQMPSGPHSPSPHHRRRATSYEATTTATSNNNNNKEQMEQSSASSSSAVLTSVRHRRAYSEETGRYMAALMDKADESGTNHHCFHELYVLTRQIFLCKHSALWECIHRESGQRYCVKMMDRNKKSEREISNLRQAQSTYTVQLFQVFREDEKVYIVMQLLNGGNLLSRVIQKGHLTECTVQHIAYQLLQGLKYLHNDLCMCHNELHPDNLLFLHDTDNHEIRIADFGSATMCGTYATTTTTTFIKSSSSTSWRCSSSPYRSPERQATAASDMWSLGVVLYFCLVGQQPYLEEKDSNALLDHLHKTKPERLQNRTISRHAKQFVSNLIHIDPDVRMTAEEALAHPWLVAITQENAARLSRSSSRSTNGSGSQEHRRRRPAKRIARSLSRVLTCLKSSERIGSSWSFHSQDATEVSESASAPATPARDLHAS